MHLLWDSIIEPLVLALKPTSILEIGCDFGDMTKKLLAYCADNHAVLHAVDPAPQFDVRSFETTYGKALAFHETLSLNVIDGIDPVDLVLIDGDHNWYTVINELRLLEHAADRHGHPFPLVLLHDVGWPYARRDLYYDPQAIPDAYRKPYAKKGIVPGKADLDDTGGINAYLNNALHENTYQNGVLTAIEDFLEETRQALTFKRLPGLNGLGVLVPSRLADDRPQLKALLDHFDCGPMMTAFIDTLERKRIDEQVAKNDYRLQTDRAVRLEDEARQALETQKQQNNQLATEVGKLRERNVQLSQRIEQSKKQTAELETNVTDFQDLAQRRLGEIERLKNITEKQDGTIREHEQRTLALIPMVDKMIWFTSVLLQSRRWRIGNRIGEVLRKLRRRPPRPMATDKIESLQKRYREWKSAYEAFLTRSIPKPKDPAPGHAAQLQSLPSLSEAALQSVYLKSSEMFYRYRQQPQTRRVSVIMPTFNDRAVIGRAIESVLGQHYRNLELIVIDDGSTDGTKDLVAGTYTDSRLRYVYIDNHGASYARNQGLKLADGDYIAYLDSDNQWYPEYLTVMVNLLEAHPEVEMAYCAQEIYDNNELVDLRFHVFNRSLLMNQNFIDINCMLHKRTLTDTLGGFDPKLPRVEDWDMALRYTQTVYPLYIQAPLVKYHKSDHYRDPLRDPRREVARQRLRYSIDRIQAKLQTRPLKLDGLDRLPVFAPRLFSPPTVADADLQPATVSIVIPSYEALDCLKLCIEAIQAYTPASCYELIVVDNASSATVVDYLRELDEQDNCRVIFNETNMGFTYAVNQGLSAAQPTHDVVLLNNDAIVTDGWLHGFVEAIRDVPDAGIVAPQQVLPANTQTMQVHVPYCTPAREVDVTVSAHHRNLARMEPLDWGKGYMALDWATFFCVYITRSCLDANGSLDHRNGRHFKSDKVYCHKVNAGHRFQVIYTPRSKVYHLVQQATQDLKRNDPEQYQLIYEQNAWDSETAAMLEKTSADRYEGKVNNE